MVTVAALYRIPLPRLGLGMLNDAQRIFLDTQRVGHLATADAAGVPHVVPVCYGVHGDALYIAIDQKPKRTDRTLKRLRNIAANPQIAVTVDRYEEDWSRLAWVMLRGRAEILTAGCEYVAAQLLLTARYPQLAAMHIADLPVIALRIANIASWGLLRAR